MDSPHLDNQRSLFRRLAAIPGLILTTVISSLLLATSINGWTTRGGLFALAVDSRASLQIVVHLVAWVLGAGQMFAIYALIKARLNFSVQKHKQGLALNEVNFWQSILSNSLDSSLSPGLLVQCLLWICVLSIPSVLWAGAITPVIVPATGLSVDVPLALYSETSADIWNLTCNWCWASGGKNGSGEMLTNDGYLGDQRLYYSQGTFLVQASAASSHDGRVPTHAKTDDTTFSFIGRSYGMGASVGLFTPTDVQSFEYSENGYLTEAECITNSTLPAQLSLVFNSSDYNNSILPNAWQPRGFLPNSDEEQFTDLLGISLSGNYSVFGVLGSSNAGRFIYKLVPGRGYVMFQDMQCELFFTPTRFSVWVDVVNQLIQVTPVANSTDFDIEETGVIKTMAFQQLWAFAAMDSTQLSSMVGRALVTNVANVAREQGSATHINSEAIDGATTDAFRFQGVAEALESIVDNSLLAFSLTQLMIANDTTTTSLSTMILAVRFGTAGYTYALFATVILMSLIFLFELIRTRSWMELQDFDVTSLKACVIGASAGGKNIASAAGTIFNGSIIGGPDAGSLRVRLQCEQHSYAIVLAERVTNMLTSQSQWPRRSGWNIPNVKSMVEGRHLFGSTEELMPLTVRR